MYGVRDERMVGFAWGGTWYSKLRDALDARVRLKLGLMTYEVVCVGVLMWYAKEV